MINDLSNVEFLPSWKRGATIEERLQELLLYVQKEPEKFKRFAIVYQEDDGSRTLTRYVAAGCDTTELLGLLVLAQWQVQTITLGKE